MKLILLSFFSIFPLFASAISKKVITFIIAEREYSTEKSIPKFAKKNLDPQFNLEYCKAPKEGERRNFLSNVSAISTADLLFVSVRRRGFREKTMKLIRKHISLGKPIIALRTSSHAFDLKKSPTPKGHQTWTQWDHDLIGGNYNGHYAKGMICKIDKVPSASLHPVLKKVRLPMQTPATLYRNSPLPSASQPLLEGRVKGFPVEPIAWIHLNKWGGEVFYTSLGHIDDFKNPAFNQLLKNAVKWCLRSKPEIQLR